MTQEIRVLQDRLANQIQRAELARAAGQTQWADKYEAMAAQTRTRLHTLTGDDNAAASADIVAGYANTARK